ncbi:hypothetical protein L9F63_005612, partial [Diploptera punctata]
PTTMHFRPKNGSPDASVESKLKDFELINSQFIPSGYRMVMKRKRIQVNNFHQSGLAEIFSIRTAYENRMRYPRQYLDLRKLCKFYEKCM